MKSPQCPKCSATELTLLQAREGSGYFHPDSGELITQTICIFKCGCGCEFPYSYRKVAAHGVDCPPSPTESHPLVAGDWR